MRKWLAILLLVAGCDGGGSKTTPPPSTPTPTPKATQGCQPRPDAGGGYQPACLTDFPHVKSHANRLMVPLTMVTIVPSNTSHEADIFAFADQVGSSAWWQSVGEEYGLAGLTNVNVSGPVMSSNLDDSQMQAYISRAISNGLAPQPDGHTLYVLYLSESFSVEVRGFCGYHTVFPTQTNALDSYAIVGWCSPFPGESAFDSVTETASHEIFEAATDPAIDSYQLGAPSFSPWTQSIWNSYHDTGAVELGDLCEGTRIYEAHADGGYRYQRMWSNAYADQGDDPCKPHLQIPYYNVVPDKEWVDANVGSSVDIPITGWATDPDLVWSVDADILSGGQAFLTSTTQLLTVSSDLGLQKPGPSCNEHPAIQNGTHAKVTVQVPSNAQSGDYAVFMVYSIARDPSTCHASLDDDPYHFTLVGVHVR